jgi:hypothetical protein
LIEMRKLVDAKWPSSAPSFVSASVEVRSPNLLACRSEQVGRSKVCTTT